MYDFWAFTTQYASFTGVMSFDSYAVDKVQKSSDPIAPKKQ
jgi:hypothetical protein